MAVNIAGLLVIGVLYILIVILGIVVGWKLKVPTGRSGYESSLVAGRDLGLVVGIFTMAATFVGGGYINGTAEGIATRGLAWTMAPFCIPVGVIMAGLLYAPPMRKCRYMTLLDPLQECYGNIMTGLLCLAQMFAEILWGASILVALGATLSVDIGIEVSIGIVVSAVVALLYTMFGHMIAVAYTDILQLIFMSLGLVLCVPFAMINPSVEDITQTFDLWKGDVSRRNVAAWMDFLMMMVLGTIPWNTFFQRALSARTVRSAKVMSCVGAGAALLLGIPPILIGAVGVSAEWNETKLGYSPLDEKEESKILPFVLQYLTPEPVAIIGLSAVAAAVMSSLDSIILSTSSMFSHNVYAMAIRPKASERELMIVQWVTMFLSAAATTAMALSVSSVYDLFLLAADFVYVMMFPQLTCALFIKHMNGYGSFIGLAIAIIMRLGGGDRALQLEPFIPYPFYDEVSQEQLFPFKTFAMLMSMTSIILVSWVSWYLFDREVLPIDMDFANCLGETKNKKSLDFKEGQVSDSVYVSSEANIISLTRL